MTSNPAAKPTALEDLQGDGRWMSMHNRFISEANEKEPEVLFVGDSLIERLQFTEIWRQMFEPLHCLNFGVGGDQTQHVLWRLMNGELECIEPKVVVLLVGTNNHDHTAEQVVGGIVAIVNLIQTQLPRTQQVVMGLPPRGEKPNKLREKISAINKGLGENLSDLPNCTFLPVDSGLYVDPNGLISPRDMPDYLHLTQQGYQKLCEPLLDCVQDLLKTFVKVDSTAVETASLAGQLAGDMS